MGGGPVRGYVSPHVSCGVIHFYIISIWKSAWRTNESDLGWTLAHAASSSSRFFSSRWTDWEPSICRPGAPSFPCSTSSVSVDLIKPSSHFGVKRIYITSDVLLSSLPNRNMWNICSVHAGRLSQQNFPKPLHHCYGKRHEALALLHLQPSTHTHFACVQIFTSEWTNLCDLWGSTGQRMNNQL